MFSSFAYNPNSQYSLGTTMQRPNDADSAKQALEQGNLAFRHWIANAFTGNESTDEVDLAQRRATLETLFPTGKVPKQTPFAAVFGCSDARVPVRQLLGQSANDIFEIRTAGQTMGDECLGSVEYALRHMPTIKTVVVLGHGSCGAVSASVDSYLTSWGLNLGLASVGLRSILQRINPAVVLAAQSIQASTIGVDFRRETDRKRLIDVATTLNAAASAHQLKLLANSVDRSDVSVLFGVYDIATHAVVRPPLRAVDGDAWEDGLALAPEEDDLLESLAAISVTAADRQPLG
ncbi:hypothetical protein M4951_13955 [Blastopirellula sp. J2-11]|uniref:carbonic anhydrase n=1 Tax=Blastopirellula sp. J2-11 TaxID=2943192 RepID=UPI0021C8A44F|nr:carbonic anhydrase [Blastopirellula sp. J2-11]UUO04496.1 hypothetical protein M4951_13955 [Blastopirellula sp. J2-11]